MRSYGKSYLSRPVVVGAGIAFHGPSARLANTALNKRAPVAHTLNFPVVVRPLASVQIGSLVSLAYSRRGKPSSHLSPPATVTPQATALARSIDVTFAVSPRQVRRASGALRCPVVIGAGIAFHGPSTRLVTPVNQRRAVSARLFTPTVVIPTAALARPLVVSLARSKRGRSLPHLSVPTVVGAGVTYRGLGIRLVYPANKRQLVAHRLSPPVSVTPQAPVVTTIALTKVRSHGGRTRSVLRAPIVVGAGIAFHGPSIRLVSPINKRFAVRTLLAKPVVVTQVAALTAPISTHLAYSKRGHARSILFTPSTVGNGLAFYGPGVRLVAPINKRAPVAHRLSAPTTTAPVAALARPLDTTLVRGRAGVAKPVLRAPAVIGGGIYFRPIDTTLSRTKVPQRFARLAPPTVVGAGIVFRPLDTTLAQIKVPKRFWKLSAPAVVSQPPAFLPAEIVRLAPSKRGKPVSHLSKPAVVGNGIVFRPIDTTLVRITPPKRFFHLSPPTVVQPIGVEFFGPITHLTYSKRGRPTSVLRAPAVIGAGIYFRGIDTTLAPSRRLVAKTKLSAPAVVFGTAFAPLTVHFTYSKRGVTRYHLSAPIFPPLARPIDTTFARPVKSRTRSVLSAPEVIGAFFEARPILTNLVRIRPAKTRYQLTFKQRFFAFAPIKTQLAPSHRFRYVTTQLNSPTVIFRPLARPILLHSVAILKRRYIPPTYPQLFPPIIKYPLQQQLYLTAGYPSDFWCSGKPISDIEDDYPTMEWCAGKPV